jgi:hypothetical protein
VLVATLASYLFVLSPLSRQRIGGQTVGPLLLTVVLSAGVYACAHRTRSLLVTLSLAVPAAVMVWMGSARETSGFTAGVWLVLATFIVAVLVYTASDVVRAQRVTADTILGAIAIYLLLAMVWAMLYAMVHAVDPSAFVLPPADAARLGDSAFRGDISPFVYYSFVTLTTMGYGDVLPAGYAARALATCEAVVGQIYLTVLVARLVGLHIADAQRS